MSGCAEGLNRRGKRSHSEKEFRVLVESRLWIASRLNPWPGLRFNEHFHEHDGPLKRGRRLPFIKSSPALPGRIVSSPG
jgi:hypothetical protein